MGITNLTSPFPVFPGVPFSPKLHVPIRGSFRHTHINKNTKRDFTLAQKAGYLNENILACWDSRLHAPPLSQCHFLPERKKGRKEKSLGYNYNSWTCTASIRNSLDACFLQEPLGRLSMSMLVLVLVLVE